MLGQSVSQTFSYDDYTAFVSWSTGRPRKVDEDNVPCGADGTPLAIRIRAPKLHAARDARRDARRARERARAGRGRRERRPSEHLAVAAPSPRQRPHDRGRCRAGCRRRGVAGVAPGPGGRRSDGSATLPSGGAPIGPRRRGGLPYLSARGAGYRNPEPIGMLAPCFSAPGVGRSGMAQVFDVVVVGGGTAGAIVAARLSEDPIALGVPAGGRAVATSGRDEVLRLRRWLELLESDYDYGYTTTLQPRGNAHIVHSRARVLGGCSSHNTQIWFKPLPLDWEDWVDAGRDGLGLRADGLVPRPHPRAARDRGREGSQPVPARLDQGRGRPAPACPPTRTGTPRRSPTASASSTSATTRPRASAPRRA